MNKKNYYPPNEITKPILQYKGNQIQGAGILPFSVHPITKDVYFLLGQEWNSNKYCDFGGRKKKQENLIQVAAREFVEETMCLPLTSYGNDRVSLTRMLYRGHFLCCIIDHKYRSQFMSGNHSAYACFLKQIPWNDQITHEFIHYRKSLLKLKKLSDRCYNLNRMIPWIIPFLRPGDITYDKYIVVKICNVLYNMENIQLSLIYKKSNSDMEEKAVWTFPLNNQKNDYTICSIYYSWVKAYNEMIDFYFSLSDELKNHPSIHIRKEKIFICDIYVNIDYLEKNRIQWFSKHQLLNYIMQPNTDIIEKHDLKAKDQFGNHIEFHKKNIFRHCFIPIIKTAISFIQNNSNIQSSSE